MNLDLRCSKKRACTEPGLSSILPRREGQVTWGALDEGLVPLVASRLQNSNRDASSARLVCRQWAAEVTQGFTCLVVKGKGPVDWRNAYSAASRD